MEHCHGQAFNLLVLQIQKLDPGEEQGSPQGHLANSNSGLLGSPPRNGDLAGSRGKLPASCVPSAGLPLEVGGSTSRFLQLPPAAPRPPEGTLCRQTGEGTTTPSRPRDIMLYTRAGSAVCLLLLVRGKTYTLLPVRRSRLWCAGVELQVREALAAMRAPL